jgi:hypothetical protein
MNNLYLKTIAVANNNGTFYKEGESYLIRYARNDKYCIIGDDNEEHWLRVQNSNFHLI